MKLAQRLTIGGLTLIAAGALLVPNAGATTAPPWGTSWCSGSTWTGQFGINNDDPYVATVTALSVTNGVTLDRSCCRVDHRRIQGQRICRHRPAVEPRFLHRDHHLGLANRCQHRPADADPGRDETGGLRARRDLHDGRDVIKHRSVDHGRKHLNHCDHGRFHHRRNHTATTDISATTAAQTSTTAARATTTASAGSGTGSSPTVLAAVQTVKLPVTGKASGRVSLLAAATIVAGVLLVSISNIGRPAATDKRR